VRTPSAKNQRNNGQQSNTVLHESIPNPKTCDSHIYEEKHHSQFAIKSRRVWVLFPVWRSVFWCEEVYFEESWAHLFATPPSPSAADTDTRFWVFRAKTRCWNRSATDAEGPSKGKSFSLPTSFLPWTLTLLWSLKSLSWSSRRLPLRWRRLWPRFWCSCELVLSDPGLLGLPFLMGKTFDYDDVVGFPGFSMIHDLSLGFKNTNKQAMFFSIFMWQMMVDEKEGYQMLCI